MPEIVIGRFDDIKPGERKIVVPFRGRAGIGVFNVEGQFFALRNICPHKLGPLCTGRVTGRIDADSPPSNHNMYSPRFINEGKIIRCPWHQWEYEIATGRCLVEPELYVKTYPVKVKDNQIVVEYTD